MYPNNEACNDEDTWCYGTAEQDFSRLDSLLPTCFSKVIVSRSAAGKLIDEGRVLVNGRIGKASTKGFAGDEIRVLLPTPTPVEAIPEDIPLDIVYEDSHIVVVNKPRGMVVHPAAGNACGTLVNALLFHCKDLSTIGGQVRPGIVHRIDKDTTGLIVSAKNDQAHLALSKQLKDHSMHRIYWAVVEGIVKDDSGTVSASIGRSLKDRKKMCVMPNGKHAVTHYTVLARNHKTKTTLIQCKLETGRTHQIRVHMAYLGHPVVGDPVYGIKNVRGMKGQALHARQLILNHPLDGRNMTFEAALPDDFKHLLKICGLEEEIG